ncbi:MAG: thymidylate synthase [bacterium]|nr:thymidylate synthase [bacterium]
MAVFDQIYQDMMKRISSEGIREVNKRTGHETTALPGLSFSVDIERDGFPLLTLRRIPIKLFVAEQVWFILGGRRPDDFLNQFTNIWDDFTNPGGVVTVAYGHRWRRHFGRDQLAGLIDLLSKDPSSRQGVVVTWDPASDGLGGVAKKNVPCPYTFTVNIMGGRLNLHNMVRSNDMILGVPHDVGGFALLQCVLAQKLGVTPGVYTHTISNAHVYDTHYHAMKELVSRGDEHQKIELHLPKDSFERAEKADQGLVEEICEDLKSQYKPGKSIKGLEIVL